MDGDIRIDLEAQSHPATLDLQHFHLEQAIKTTPPRRRPLIPVVSARELTWLNVHFL